MVTLECIYGQNSFLNGPKMYFCVIDNQEIPEDAELNVDGKHKFLYTNDDVMALWIRNCTTPKIPKGFTKIFPNLKILEINNSSLKEIDKNDLIEYRNLEKICIANNPIRMFPGDMFEGFTNLDSIVLRENDLEIIEPNFLDGLDQLKYVEISSGCDFKCYSICPNLKSNKSLQELKIELSEKFLSKFKYARHLQDSKKELQQEIQETKNFLRDEKFKDFKIIVDDKEFYANKMLLAFRSLSFADIFRSTPTATYAVFNSISANAFEQILKYIYTDEFPNEIGINYMNLLAGAENLQIKELENYAEMKVLEEINVDNALEIFEKSNKHKFNGLRQKAYGEIKKKYPRIQFEDEWLMEPKKVTYIIENLKKHEEEVRNFEKRFEKFFKDN